jgi:O-antigen ligase
MEKLSKHLKDATRCFTGAAVIAPLFGIALASIFLALALLSLILHAGLTHNWRFSSPPIKLPLLLFMGATLVSLAFSPEPLAGRAAINKFWIFLLIPLLASSITPDNLPKILKGLWTAGSIAAVFSMIQYGFVVNKPDGWRITGFMGHWMTLSGELLLVLLAELACVLFFPLQKKIFGGGGMLLMGMAILLTMTRSIWIALLASVIFLLWLRFHQWKLVGGVLVLLLLAGLVMPTTIRQRVRSIWDPADPSNYARTAIWKAGIKMIEAHPWIGVGPQRISKVFYDYHPHPEDRLRSGFYPIHLHNNLLQFAAERGIPCALAWLWLILKLAWDHWKGFRRALPQSLEQALRAIGLTTLVAMFIAGQFEFNFGDSEVLILILFLTISPYYASWSPIRPASL